MNSNPAVYLLVALGCAFLGTLPFGPVNLSVIRITVSEGRGTGCRFALAASLVELIEAAIAIFFGMIILGFLRTHPLLKLLIGFGFLLAGTAVLLRSHHRQQASTVRLEGRSGYLRGTVVALMNPQAIPFWLFALAAVDQYLGFRFQGIFLVAFLCGVFLGKLVALMIFLGIGNYLAAHLNAAGIWVDRILGVVLLIIGLAQLLHIPVRY